MERASKYFYVMSQQPNLVNTALLDGNPVMSDVTLVLLDNDLASRDLSSGNVGEIVDFGRHDVTCIPTSSTNVLTHNGAV